MFVCNVTETEHLLRACAANTSVRQFILASSYFVNVSSKWPTVWNPEVAPLPPREEWPFPEYCASKLAAEQLVLTVDRGNNALCWLVYMYCYNNT